MRTETVVGLDLGGTHVSAGRIDPATRTIEEYVRLELPAGASRGKLLARIVDAVTTVGRDRVGLIGLAVPGPFDYANGVSLLTEKLEALHRVDLRRELRSALRPARPAIAFVNDADAFLLGEWWAGAAAGHRRAVGVTLGTGLGSAFLDDGQIVDTGPSVPPEGSLHLVSYRGRPVEETVSRRAAIAHFGDPALDVHDLARLARGGDERARLVFTDLSYALGEVVAPWLTSFQATCLVVGGSIGRSWELIKPGLREALAETKHLETIARATQIDEAALLGAAHVAVRGISPEPVSPLAS